MTPEDPTPQPHDSNPSQPASQAAPARSPAQQAAIAAVLLAIIAGSVTIVVKSSSRYMQGPAASIDGLARTLRGYPIEEREGKTMLWAGADADPQTNDVWFDVTDSAIEPRNFNHGIGKDTIASIDDPRFLAAADPKLKQFGISDETLVIGHAAQGESKAYPIFILNRHEIVNDRFGDKPMAVAW